MLKVRAASSFFNSFFPADSASRSLFNDLADGGAGAPSGPFASGAVLIYLYSPIGFGKAGKKERARGKVVASKWDDKTIAGTAIYYCALERTAGSARDATIMKVGGVEERPFFYEGNAVSSLQRKIQRPPAIITSGALRVQRGRTVLLWNAEDEHGR